MFLLVNLILVIIPFKTKPSPTTNSLQSNYNVFTKYFQAVMHFTLTQTSHRALDQTVHNDYAFTEIKPSSNVCIIAQESSFEKTVLL